MSEPSTETAPYLIFERATDVPIVWFEFALPAGAAAEPIGAEGLMRHVAQLMRRGTAARSRAALDAALDDLGATVDFSVDKDAFAVSGVCLAEHLLEVVDLAAEMIATPRLAEEEHAQLVRESCAYLDDLRDDDASLATRFFDLHVAPGHPYARTSMGTAASLTGLSIETVRATSAQICATDNAILGIAGHVDDTTASQVSATLADALARAVRAHATRSTPWPRPASPPPAPTGRRLIVVDKPERSQSQVRIGHVGPGYGSDDAITFAVIENAFGGTFSSRLTQEIRVANGWSYGAGCVLKRSRMPHWFTLYCAPALEVTTPALSRMLEMYEELHRDGLRADEVEFAKDYLIGSLPFHRATARQRMGQAVRGRLVGLPDDYFDRLAGKLAAVTVEDTRRVIETYCRPADVLSLVVTSADQLAGQLAESGAGPMTVVDYESY